MALNTLGLAKTYRQLAKVPSQVSSEAADAFNARIQAGFDTGTDPYGNAWAELAPRTLAKGRTPPPLTDTRAMRSNTVLVPMPGAGMRLRDGFGMPYGIRHMAGYPPTRLPKRRFFPDSGMPAAWRADLQSIFAKRVRATVNGE